MPRNALQNQHFDSWTFGDDMVSYLPVYRTYSNMGWCLMRINYAVLAGLLLTVILAAAVSAQTDKVIYVPRYYDPALKEIEEKADSLQALQDTLTDQVRDRQEEWKDREKDSAKSLRFDFSRIVKPASPEVFKPVIHFPPVAQYRTGTCWCFSGTSFFESEVTRLSGRRIKLSEIHTVYYEYLEKVRGFMRERGDFDLGEGSESNAVVRIMKKYGAMPKEDYPGVGSDERHDHDRLIAELTAYLNMLKAENLWDEEEAVAHARVILNKYLGEPPTSFTFEGKTMTPLQFLNDVLQLKLDDYVDVMSTLAVPFYTRGEFTVPDNWWHDSSYCNLPLDEWYAVIVNAIRNGYSLAIGGDNSEPGYNGFENAAVIPDFDIPATYINQDSREYRIHNETTTDDHGLHLVGYTTVDGRDWFLLKDSGRSARWGKYEGYYFTRDDYIRLKMLTYTVHKDALKEFLPRFNQAPR
jgi:bleomycin hydrolase